MSIVTRFRLNEKAKPPVPQESGSHRMQIVMSEASAQKLTDLRDMLEASSYGEVVRRALQYYERLLHRFNLSSVLPDNFKEEGNLTAHVQIVLPSRTLERLETLKSGTPTASYGEIIRTALTVYRKAFLAQSQGEAFIIRRENGEPITVHPVGIAA